MVAVHTVTVPPVKDRSYVPTAIAGTRLARAKPTKKIVDASKATVPEVKIASD